jgi:hypothetical protein
MKSIVALLAGILAANLCAQECDFTAPERGSASFEAYFGYPAMALYLFEGNHLDLSNMGKREPAVKNVSGSDTLWVYRSALDSSLVVIAAEAFVKVARVAYSANADSSVDTLFSVHHDDVYKDEFARLQKAGVFKGTTEQADSLVNHVLELCGEFRTRELGYAGCIFNPPDHRRGNGGKDVDVADVPLAIFTVAAEFNTLLDTLNFCPSYKFPPASSVEAVPAIRTDKTTPGIFAVKVKPRHYYISNVKDGTPYKAFSVNGQLLEQGILTGGQFIAPATPVLLQLNGSRMVMLK